MEEVAIERIHQQQQQQEEEEEEIINPVENATNYSAEYIEKIKNTIETMDKYHQIEILKILAKNSTKINENKSGVYVNLSFLPKNTIQQLADYIDYIRDQEDSLITMEYQKEEFKNTFFTEKEDKDNPLISYYNK
jgi:coenzyme F420-reducing hydrogenase alpha subunit